MSAHTPGPWTLHEDYPQVIVAAAEPTMSLLGLKIESGREDDPIAQVASIEDARLMASAPELLKALKEMVDYHGPAADHHGEDCPDDDCQGCALDKLVNAAIAKAEGRS